MLLLATLIAAPAFGQSADEVLARSDDEPTVLEVQTAAMTYAGLHTDRLESWYCRANMAYILPEVAEYRIKIDDDFREIERLLVPGGSVYFLLFAERCTRTILPARPHISVSAR